MNATIRYVRRPDGLYFVTILSDKLGPGFVFQPAAFVRITGISPRSTLGSTSVNDAQLAALTGIPTKGAEKPASERIRYYSRKVNAYSAARFDHLRGRSAKNPPATRYERLMRYKAAIKRESVAK